jgi:hypothetical protein
MDDGLAYFDCLGYGDGGRCSSGESLTNLSDWSELLVEGGVTTRQMGSRRERERERERGANMLMRIPKTRTRISFSRNMSASHKNVKRALFKHVQTFVYNYRRLIMTHGVSIV